MFVCTHVASPVGICSVLWHFVCFSKHILIKIVLRATQFTSRRSIARSIVLSAVNVIYLIWCDFDRASSLICGNKMPNRSKRGFYCRSYCLLNMFRAPLCPSSGTQEYYTMVAACGICKLGGIPPNLQITFYIFTARNTTGSNHCIILLSSWWWA